MNNAERLLESQSLIKQVVASCIVYRPNYSDDDRIIKKAKILQKEIDKLKEDK